MGVTEVATKLMDKLDQVLDYVISDRKGEEQLWPWGRRRTVCFCLSVSVPVSLFLADSVRCITEAVEACAIAP